MYRQTTNDIEVSVEPFYLEEQSEPDEQRFVWGYQIDITNHSDQSVKLVHRYWHITDEQGIVDEVSGKGVVGKEPVLKPGETYQYSSGCPLDTPSGIMVGKYKFKTSDGSLFDVAIPAFSLDMPNHNRVLN